MPVSYSEKIKNQSLSEISSSLTPEILLSYHYTKNGETPVIANPLTLNFFCGN
jgi:hypothetical protein